MTKYVDGGAIFRKLKNIQLALRVFAGALLVATLIFIFWISGEFSPWHSAFIAVAVLFFACVVIALGALAYLITSRCPNCGSKFSRKWLDTDVLRSDKAGRCENCGIRINVPSF